MGADASAVRRCDRCGDRALYGRRFCRRCLSHRRKQPLQRAHERPAAKGAQSPWALAQEELCPNRPYHSLTRDERAQIDRRASELAGLTEWLDDAVSLERATRRPPQHPLLALTRRGRCL